MSTDDLPLASSPPVEEAAKRRRNRTTQSCLNCHTSKRKCDRRRPCSRCIQLGLTGLCVYEVDDPSLRDDPSSDEATRLKNRIAELESLVRELRGKPHPKWADSPVEDDRRDKWHSRASKKRKTYTPDAELDTDRESSEGSSESTDTANIERQVAAAPMPVLVKTEPDSPEFRRAPVATSGARTYIPPSYPMASTSSPYNCPPYASPMSASSSFSASAPMALYTDSSVQPTLTPLQTGAPYSTTATTAYPDMSSIPDHLRDFRAIPSSDDRISDMVPNTHPPLYDRIVPTTAPCTCLMSFASMSALIRLQQKVQQTVEEMRNMPSHVRYGQGPPSDDCQILQKLEELSDFLHGRNYQAQSSYEWEYQAQQEVVRPSSYHVAGPTGSTMQQQMLSISPSAWPAMPTTSTSSMAYFSQHLGAPHYHHSG